MALYAIGDVQGCYDSLRRLVDKIRFDPAADTLWFTGDLVNRGPRSLEVLRFVAELGARAVTVLGNHDLHLLAIASGARSPGERDTIQDILAAPDRDELLRWLAGRPLLYRDAEANFILIHAGLLPQWDIDLAERCAREVEAVINGPDAGDFYADMYGNQPDLWRDDLRGIERLRLIVNAFTRLRFCDADGRVDYEHNGAPGTQPPSLFPWFAVPGRRSRGHRIVFGHWSLLGLYSDGETTAIDTGCCWGRALTAIRLSGGAPGELEHFVVECHDKFG